MHDVSFVLKRTWPHGLWVRDEGPVLPHSGVFYGWENKHKLHTSRINLKRIMMSHRIQMA